MFRVPLICKIIPFRESKTKEVKIILEDVEDNILNIRVGKVDPSLFFYDIKNEDYV